MIEENAVPVEEEAPPPPVPDAGDVAPTEEVVTESEPVAEELPPPPTPEKKPVPSAMPAPPMGKKWYVVKVTSGREESIKNALERRVRIDGLEEHFGRILIPTEKVTEVKGGRRVEKKRKKFPGYLMCEVEFNDKILYLFRETAGVGDFVGGSLHKIPTPMTDREVERMLLDMEETPVKKKEGEGETQPTRKVVLNFAVGDRVKVLHGMFKDTEGEVKEIHEPTDPTENPKVKVAVMIWGRPVDVDVEYWHVDPI